MSFSLEPGKTIFFKVLLMGGKEDSELAARVGIQLGFLIYMVFLQIVILGFFFSFPSLPSTQISPSQLLSGLQGVNLPLQ